MHFCSTETKIKLKNKTTAYNIHPRFLQYNVMCRLFIEKGRPNTDVDFVELQTGRAICLAPAGITIYDSMEDARNNENIIAFIPDKA